MDIFGTVGNTLGNLSGVITIMLILAAVGTIVALLYFSGLLNRRPYTCIIKVPRADNTFKTLIKNGRFISKGKFEIFYGFGDMRQVTAPMEEYIKEGNIIEGVSKGGEEIIWLPHEEISEESIRRSAAIPEAAQMAFATAYDAYYQRTHKLQAWMQFIPMMSFLIGVIIIAAALYIQGNMLSESNRAVADSNHVFAEKLLANSSIVIYRASAETSSGFPNQPTTTSSSKTPAG